MWQLHIDLQLTGSVTLLLMGAVPFELSTAATGTSIMQQVDQAL
jgi:hypothetical protein